MNFTNFILDFLNFYGETRRDMIRNLYGHGPYEYLRKDLVKKNLQFKKIKKSSLRTIIWRLKKQGLIKNENEAWRITEKGREYLKKVFKLKNNNKKLVEKGKKIIIIFDIPEEFSKKRRWLRSQLILMKFKLLQKSVWIGPSPLPKEFIQAVNELSILKFVKFFKVSNKNLI